MRPCLNNVPREKERKREREIKEREGGDEKKLAAIAYAVEIQNYI